MNNLFSITEISNILEIAPRTVLYLLNNGKLEYNIIGGKKIISKDQLLKFLKSHEEKRKNSINKR
jgi:excisionase family DNA binding protein